MISLILGVPVEVTLANHLYKVRQYRLIDIARLEAWAMVQLDGPSVAIEMALASDDAEERANHLRRASDMADRMSFYGSPEIGSVLATTEGTAYQLRLAIVKRKTRINKNGKMSLSESIDLAKRITLSDWLRFSRIAYGIHPLDQVSSIIDVEIGVPPSEDKVMEYRDWRESIKYAVEHGISPSDLMNLPIRLWDAAVSGKVGSHPVAEPDLPDPETWQETADARSEFWKSWNGNGHPNDDSDEWGEE